jgi:poly(A) polymerase
MFVQGRPFVLGWPAQERWARGSMERLYDVFEAAGRELFLVGGAVRDLLMGAPIEELDDLDFCTNARPQETLSILCEAGFSTYDVGIEFGTIGCVLRSDKKGYPKDCQITTYRSSEFYRRGDRHPVVQYGDTIAEDLGRRDLSINSIAMDRDGRTIDPYGGCQDIETGRIRVVGDPEETLAEDPLRILRVGRFISKLGFEPDASLRKASLLRADHILDISRERWLMEMDKLLVGPHVCKALAFLFEVRILGMILPEVVSLVDLHRSCEVHHKDVWAHTLQVVTQTDPDQSLRWVALLHDIGKSWTRSLTDTGEVTFYRHEQHGAMLFEGISKRFRFDRDRSFRIGFMIANHGRIAQYQSEWSDAALRRLVRDLDPCLADLLRFARSDLTTGIASKREEALARIDELERRLDELDRQDALRVTLPRGIGKAVMEAFELEPSPAVGQCKNFLEHEMIEGRLESDREIDYYIGYLKRQSPGVIETASIGARQ